jgi:hypothetical protein
MPDPPAARERYNEGGEAEERGASRMSEPGSIVMEEVSDPRALAQARAQRQRFDRNAAWFQAHATEVYPKYRGKYLCIAGEELFVADTAEQALAMAAAAHPDDDGSFVLYVPREKVARIYADRGRVVPLR